MGIIIMLHLLQDMSFRHISVLVQNFSIRAKFTEETHFSLRWLHVSLPESYLSVHFVLAS